MGVENLTSGGSNGYLSGIVSVSKKVPLEYGDSAGPWICASHFSMLSSIFHAEIPGPGSLDIISSSFVTLPMHALFNITIQ